MSRATRGKPFSRCYSRTCLREYVQMYRQESLLTTPAVCFLALFIFVLGLFLYILMIYIRLVRQSNTNSARSSSMTDDAASSIISESNNRYMIERQLTPTTGYPVASRPDAPYAPQQQATLAASQWSDTTISPSSTTRSNFPLTKPSNAYSRDADNYSINSQAEQLSIRTAATKASSSSEAISRTTSLTASDSDAYSGPFQFFPITLNETQTGTWRSGSSRKGLLSGV